ncbi:DUF1624 domain-containing protein [Chryseolinea soli]|uniref:DUF1624 domain-containing protein n=1 Tax=Chryseolinea soli TaxID=2321403 RepID=A0A385STW8_9BACT|nr:heparan-alpha-glucosaminide N-acetyltransferase domain-containing protein [Chryseolinea soli]AYB33130.1 DUF1624 domain-containing protein [Chryseolinea soli]
MTTLENFSRTYSVESIGRVNRVESIDLLRGMVMIIMAIDHVRDLFHFDAFLYSPEDLTRTSAALFFTRWITHLCAPTFIFLAGTSSYFVAKRKTKKEMTVFLLTRGLWLIVLQLTIVRFGWHFDPLFRYNGSSIISIIGCCMIVLAGLIHLPLSAIFFFGLALVVGHNRLDHIAFASGSTADVVWSFLHVSKVFDLGHGYRFSLLYPLIPWAGVMSLGYCLGRWYDADFTSDRRRELLLTLGALSLFIFVGLRLINRYGDPLPWSVQPEWPFTVMSFFNLEKYPPSLLYVLATIGISLTLLGLLEGKKVTAWKPVSLFGKVALFYYVAHIYLIHLLAMIAAVLTGFSWRSMIFSGAVAKGNPELVGHYGFSLPQVYIFWISVVLLLYPLCVFWNDLKIRNKEKWWVSYV